MTFLGKAIAEQRAERKFSLREAAKVAALSHEAVRKVEAGEGTIESAVRIAVALGLPRRVVCDLLTQDLPRLVARMAA